LELLPFTLGIDDAGSRKQLKRDVITGDWGGDEAQTIAVSLFHCDELDVVSSFC
jgi:hypothetical protein